MLQGLLAGAGTMGAIESMRLINKAMDSRKPDKKMKSVDLEKQSSLQKIADLGSPIYDLGSVVSGLKDVGGSIAGGINEATGMGEGVQGNLARNIAMLGMGGLGVVGVKELFDKIRKEQAKSDANNAREYYYERLLEEAGKGDYSAEAESVPLQRKEAGALSDLSLFTALFGSFLVPGYLAKKYMDEKMPGPKQPSAKNDNDPRSHIGRVFVNEKDEDDEETKKKQESQLKLFDGVGKEASFSPSVEKSFDCATLVRTILGNTKQAKATSIRDIVRTVETEGTQNLKKFAQAADLERLIDHAEKTASEQKTHPSTERSRHLAVDLVSSDPNLRSVVYPLACAETLEQFPSSVKTASQVPEECAKAGRVFIKSAVLEEEDKLFGEPELKDGRKFESASSFASYLDNIFTPSKSAGDNNFYAELREELFRG